jgi:hypothetical protein
MTTDNEHPAAEAAAEALRREFYDGVGTNEFAEAGRAAACAAEPHHQIAAFEEAAEAMDNAESLEARNATVSSQRNRFGLKLAAKLLREQAAAIRAELAEEAN